MKDGECLFLNIHQAIKQELQGLQRFMVNDERENLINIFLFTISTKDKTQAIPLL